MHSRQHHARPGRDQKAPLKTYTNHHDFNSNTYESNNMQFITQEQAASFFDQITIEQTIDTGTAITHVCNAGTAEHPARFVFVNDTSGKSFVAPDFFNNK
jgi:hypothetical protein